MLRITPCKSAAGAAEYFQQADYYASGEKETGIWGGKAAARLGLSGEASKEDFLALCQNRKPDGSKLTPRDKDNRKVGYDFTFSVPKSVSVAYAVTGDERIREAFEQSVEATMREIEQEMRTQTGQGKDKQLARTGEMVWASFTHRTTRPLADGIPDPHLHRHCFALNTTWNADAGRFQAGEFSPIKQAAPYYEAACDARLAMKIRELGYRVERRGLSWEIRGIENDTLQKFSRRTALIEQRAEKEHSEKGLMTAKQKEKLGALTRAKKLVGQSWEKLRQVWKSWLSKEEAGQIARAGMPGEVEKKPSAITAEEAVSRAQHHLFERKSVVAEYQLKAEALKRGYGEISPETVNQAVKNSDFYQREIKGQPFLTTREAVAEEHAMLTHVHEGRGKHFPLNDSYEPKADYLSEEQRYAIKHALSDTNSVTLIAGGAGTGKTTLMKEIRDGIEERGKAFYGFAPSAAASRRVMREEGFAQADTLAQLLNNPELQKQTKNNVIWVDEAGLIGNKDMNRLFEIAKNQKARLLLTGDSRQHSGVARGDALRILEREAGIKVMRVKEIQRQKNSFNYKMAVSLAAEGKADAALLKLANMGEVIEISEGKARLDRLVEDYAQSARQGKSTLIVSPTHIEGHEVTQVLRERLKQEGRIEGEDRQFLQLKNLNWTEENKTESSHYQQQKLTLEFHQNGKDHVRGERWQVTANDPPQLHSIAVSGKDETRQQIDLKLANRFTVYQRQEIGIAKGDIIRITKGGATREGVRLNTGDRFTVSGFTRDGHIKLHTGKTLDKDFGHLAQGYVTTSHSSQGKTVDHVFIAESAVSYPAASQQQFYVSISRGRERCRIYTDDKKALEQAVKRDGQRMTAREIAAIDHSRIKRKMREKTTETPAPKQKDYGKGVTV